jgi:hypothetical protein
LAHPTQFEEKKFDDSDELEREEQHDKPLRKVGVFMLDQNNLGNSEFGGLAYL